VLWYFGSCRVWFILKSPTAAGDYLFHSIKYIDNVDQNAAAGYLLHPACKSPRLISNQHSVDSPFSKVQANLILGQEHACAHKAFRCGLNSHTKLTVLIPFLFFSLKHSTQGSHRLGLLFFICFACLSLIRRMLNSDREILDMPFSWV